MAFIDHRCTQCRHPKSNNTGGCCNNGHCRCACTYGPPEVITTYTLAGQPITALTAPGEPMPYRSDFGATCDCQDCRDLHTPLANGGAAS